MSRDLETPDYQPKTRKTSPRFEGMAFVYLFVNQSFPNHAADADQLREELTLHDAAAGAPEPMGRIEGFCAFRDGDGYLGSVRSVEVER